MLATEVAKEKEYVAEIKLGVTSSTDDEEGEKLITENPVPPTIEEIKKILPDFVGKIKQKPPSYSAVKVAGKEAYKYMRSGKPVALEEREVEIRSIELLNYEWPILKLRVVTGPGVYIRSLARDLGQSLAVRGYISSLERIRVGEFTVEKSLGLDKILSGFYKK